MSDSIRRKLRRPLPLRGIERQWYVAVMLSVLLGIAWSLSTRDWQYFERAGALVIVVAISLAWRDHVSLLGDVERFYRDEFQRLLTNFDAARPPGIIAGAMHDGQRDKIVSAHADAHELMELLRHRLRTTEAVFLCMGTVIWGYGSIIANLLWPLP